MAEETANTNILSTLSTGLADAVERIGPALVQVNGRRRQAASGVVFAEEQIITADHVLEREEDLEITTHDGRTLAATFVGRDPSSDLAVLYVKNLNLAPATAAQRARVGQLLLSVGRPSKEGAMASLGIVNSVGGPLRTRRGGMLEQYIRTDAIPYPGFSGGPLINAEGQVLAIMTTGLQRGVAVGIPAYLAWRIGQTLSKHGKIKRGYLGINSQPVKLPESQHQEAEQKSALLIIHVEPDSPAENGGLLLGDILLTLDGVSLSDTSDLQALLESGRVGETVPIEVIRGGQIQTLDITIGERK